MTLAKRAFTALSDRLHPSLLAPIGSVLLSVRRRDRCTVRYADGDWIHRYRGGIVVGPALGGPTAGWQDRDTWDAFLYGYRPGRGDTVLDIGAGVGGEVRVLSRLVGSTGRVVSVEAHPRIYRCLRRTVELNRLDNVTTMHCAVTGAPGGVFIENDTEHHLGNGLTTDAAAGIAVTGRTLADIVDELGIVHIDLLKMNIEGAELSVLDAAREVLPAVRNLVVSCHDFVAGPDPDDGRRTFDRVRRLLERAGYAIRTREHDPRPWIRCYVYASR